MRLSCRSNCEFSAMSLTLDARQRAMLAEMGVRDWAPEVQIPAQAVSAPIAIELAEPPRVEPLAVKPVLADARRPQGVAQMDWALLQSAVAECQACDLCKTRQRTVFGVGASAPEGQAPQVDWLIVGEAPGENEDRQGEPFVGQAGKLLDNMLRSCGLSRTAPATQGGGVYIVNVLKCRPPGNRNPRPEEVAQCEPFLQRQVQLLRPKIIIAMGRFAVQSLLQGSVPQIESQPLGKLRGKVYHYHGVPVVVTYHPAYLLRSLAEKAKAWADLCLAMAQLNRPAS